MKVGPEKPARASASTSESLVSVAPSPIQGQGLFARQTIRPRQRVIEYIGQKINKGESLLRCQNNNPFIFYLNARYDLDGGVAWYKGEKPSFLNGGTREPVTSGGVSLRTNLLGFAVAQIDYARPFDRPGRGWVWGFSLTPGF